MIPALADAADAVSRIRGMLLLVSSALAAGDGLAARRVLTQALLAARRVVTLIERAIEDLDAAMGVR